MTKRDDSVLWLAGGLAALGLLALASSQREPTRQSFDDALRFELESQGVRLVSAELGRQRGVAVWVVA
ncbi:MAG: hypothetical protein KC766_32335, partial [Myxococcales bacterium]|nr:hypothetical protein [Myxococcales bacterium]